MRRFPYLASLELIGLTSRGRMLSISQKALRIMKYIYASCHRHGLSGFLGNIAHQAYITLDECRYFASTDAF